MTGLSILPASVETPRASIPALPRSSKLIELDALRGLAAFIVFSGHFFEGLVPSAKAAIDGTFLYGVLNGPAAVVAFFVLSGFVLTLQPLRLRRWGLLFGLVIKRWPRLAGPVVAGSLLYVLAATLRLFPRPDQAGALVRPPPYLFWGQSLQDERLGSVLREAAFGAFAHGTARHNAVLWTMHWEFLGSFLSASLAAVVLLPLPRWARALLFALLWVGAGAYSPWLVAFPLGVALAVVHRSAGPRLRLSNGLAVALAVCGTLLLSWNIIESSGVWAWSRALGGAARISCWVATQSAAAALWMLVALYNQTARRCLRGKLGAFAGRLSFSFYILHLLVLLSLTSWLVIWWMPAGPSPGTVAAAFAVSTAAAVAVSIPLMIFDAWWTRAIAKAVYRLTVTTLLAKAN